jgi:cation diffusion facilitator CzcD-associated flavoprotein CzcO
MSESMNKSSPSSSNNTERDAVIVGAGFAGLYAARATWARPNGKDHRRAQRRRRPAATKGLHLLNFWLH